MSEKHIQSGGESQPRPLIYAEECKGCSRCVVACPRKVLRLGDRLNRKAFRPAEYTGEGCTGCCICFYNCPEPYALEVEMPSRPAKDPQKRTN